MWDWLMPLIFGAVWLCLILGLLWYSRRVDGEARNQSFGYLAFMPVFPCADGLSTLFGWRHSLAMFFAMLVVLVFGAVLNFRLRPLTSREFLRAMAAQACGLGILLIADSPFHSSASWRLSVAGLRAVSPLINAALLLVLFRSRSESATPQP